jgi:3-keto-disaccharide hydrolase
MRTTYRRMTALGAGLALMALAAAALCQAPADEGWVELFNGKDLTGWKLVNPDGPNGWSVKDGILTNVSTEQQRSTDLMTERTFTDFELHVEFRVPPGGNSGVYPQGRYEVQVLDSASATELGPGICGGIWATAPPLKNAAKPAGEWQTFDITFTAPQFDRDGKLLSNARATVLLNGEKVQDNTEIKAPTGGEVDRNVSRPGPLMLQGNHTSVEYRNIRYRPLRVGWAPETEFAPIFDGKSLAGWHTEKTGHGTGGKWEVADGVITGTQDKPGNGGLLLSDAKYSSFEIRVEINPEWDIDSGLFLRCQPDGRCYQVTIDYRPGGEVGTMYGEGIGGWIEQNPGWFWFYNRDTWNELRAIIEGQPPRIRVWLNANQTVDMVDKEERLPADGHIALQVHGGGDWQGRVTRFRNIRIRPLE